MYTVQAKCRELDEQHVPPFFLISLYLSPPLRHRTTLILARRMATKLAHCGLVDITHAFLAYKGILAMFSFTKKLEKF